ncbi:lanthionine synthetase LanC family protein [Aquimarina sp. 2304DJ70-9]|uniref:lanthionine synthetase LanC family protein n=1 Tax=Aquimarina penaris TaxID=3231044 RepID=UPI00346300E4
MERSEILKIENRVWNSVKNENSIGLLKGLSGIALFYSKLFEVYEDEKYVTRLLEVVERIDELVSKNTPSYTFYSGLAGYGWMLLNLKKNIVAVSETYFETLDSILEEALLSFSNKNNYDFLHGATGVAMYFIERLKAEKNNANVLTILTHFSKDFLDKLIHDLDKVIVSIENEGKKKVIYFGLAHGISSFINFLFYLSKYIQSLEPEIKQALIKLINFLKSKKSFNTISQQYYPNYIDNHGTVSVSRLGWCQGDLGIGLSLYNAGILLNDNTIKKEAIELITSTEKVSLKASAVYDCVLCHGSAGLVVQYYLAQKKGALDTKEIQKRWYRELEKQTGNFTTFKTYVYPDFIENSNILTGVTGIVLMLLTLDGKIESDWLRSLNLH